MAIKAIHGTTQSQGSTQSVQIPGFFKRIAIKISALWNGINTKQFDLISNQYSKAHQSLYKEKDVNPSVYQGYQSASQVQREAIRKLDALPPTPRLESLKSQISEVQRQIDSLQRDYNATYEHEEIAYSYIGSGGGYDGTQDRAEISAKISPLESKLSKLESEYQAERRSMADANGIQLPKQLPALSDDYLATSQLYKRTATSIAAAHKASPNLSLKEVAVLSMPIYITDTQRRNLERFLS